MPFRLHLTQPEELSVDREEDLIEENFLWKRQRQGDTSLEGENSLSERQEEKDKRVTETAFLVSRTNQQSLALVVVGSPLFSFSELVQYVSISTELLHPPSV